MIPPLWLNKFENLEKISEVIEIEHTYRVTGCDDEEKDFSEVVKEEKAKLKSQRRSITEVARDSRASLSFYRIAAYILLVLGFFYLNRHDYLHIPSYLFALSVPPVIVVIMLLKETRKHKTDRTGVSMNEK